MTIEITQPELEALINQRLESGEYKDAEDVILRALRQSSHFPAAGRGNRPAKNIEELFAPLQGLNLDFSRNPSTGRPIEL